MKIRKILTSVVAASLALTMFAGCGSSSSSSDSSKASSSSSADSSKASGSSDSDSSGAESTDKKDLKEIKALADLTPHSEILQYIEPELNKKGYTINIVSTASDATWNEKTQNGEVDFNYFQHDPYLTEWNEINNGKLVNIGNIHVEPIAAYSAKYSSADEVPDNATIVIPDDATNEYRALRILEKQGWIKLGETENARASRCSRPISSSRSRSRPGCTYWCCRR